MSHFIQDNQAFVKTVDGKYLFFVKGGDSNVYSHQNKRLSNWSLFRVFENKEQYDALVENMVRGDIHGGSWQFASLKNKSFNGYTEYENLVCNRFENAWKKALLINRSISDVTIDNVREFERDVAQLLQDNKFSLNDQDGYESKDIICSRYRTDEEARINAVENLNSVCNKYTEDGTYRRYCSQWSKTPLSECLQSSDFCKTTASFSTNWLNPSVSIVGSTKIYDISDENLFSLMDIDVVHLLDNYWLENIYKNYPTQFKYLLENEDGRMLKQIMRYRELLEPENYSFKHIMKNVALIESFIEEYEGFVVAQNEIDTKLKSEAPQKFIDTWNKLIDYCWYKQTWSTLPYHLVQLKEFIALGVNLDEVKDKCEEDLRGIVRKHQSQNKKNQGAIKKGAEEILSLYYELLSHETIEMFCRYFGIKRPVAIKNEVTISVPTTPRIAHVGTLF
jgi:hypothetical protein